MSALDQALRQIDQQRQWRDKVPSQQGLMSEFYEPFVPARTRTSYWTSAALVVLSLALVGTWLAMAGWWSVPLKTLSDWRSSGKPSVADAVALPSTPVSSAPAPALPILVTPTTEAAALTVRPIESVKPGLVDPGNKFIYPAWHKGGDRLWGWGLWEDASRSWLTGLKTQEPQTQMLLIADQLTQLQVTRRYATWSPLLPVVALPKSGVTKKRWVLLAVPAAHDMARAQDLFRMAQGQEATVEPWTHWQKVLRLNEGSDGAVAQAAQNMAPAPAVLAAPSPVTSPASRPAVPNAAALASPPASARAIDPSQTKAQGESLVSSLTPSAQEPAQLSRTEAERLPTSGPVPPAAKAIDVDYQLIEKSLARGDHQAALEAAIKLEKYIGENWRTQYLAGVALMGLSRWEPAITALSKALELNPRHATAALYLSVALQERGEHARAIQVLGKALQLQPLSPELWLNQGHSHQALGQKVEAHKAYNRFLELSLNRQDLAVQRVWVQNRLQKDNG
jgi:tetratricopeptide (TPR) repeat protein